MRDSIVAHAQRHLHRLAVCANRSRRQFMRTLRVASFIPLERLPLWRVSGLARPWLSIRGALITAALGRADMEPAVAGPRPSSNVWRRSGVMGGPAPQIRGNLGRLMFKLDVAVVFLVGTVLLTLMAAHFLR
jgi:hypothetical protein